MAKRILKYELKLKDLQKLKLPIGSKFLSVLMRCSKPYLWAEVPGDVEQTETLLITQVLTGEYVPEESSYMTTILLDDYTIHIYYKVITNA